MGFVNTRKGEGVWGRRFCFLLTYWSVLLLLCVLVCYFSSNRLSYIMTMDWFLNAGGKKKRGGMARDVYDKSFTSTSCKRLANRAPLKNEFFFF